MFITRLFAPTIALAIVTISHIANALGADVPAFMVSPVIGAMIISIGVLIAIIGFKIGWWILVCLAGVSIACIYVYFQYELNIITIMPSQIMMNILGGIGLG